MNTGTYNPAQRLDRYKIRKERTDEQLATVKDFVKLTNAELKEDPDSLRNKCTNIGAKRMTQDIENNRHHIKKQIEKLEIQVKEAK